MSPELSDTEQREPMIGGRDGIAAKKTWQAPTVETVPVEKTATSFNTGNDGNGSFTSS